MNIEVVSVTFLPNGDIDVSYRKDGLAAVIRIPKKAELRRMMDALLLNAIKAALSLE